MRATMTKSMRSVAMAVSMAALAACASKTTPPAASTAQAPSPAPTPVTSGTISEGTVRAEATVESIDQKTRKVTLRRADGSKTTIKAGPEVKRLNEIKKGDVVV